MKLNKNLNEVNEPLMKDFPSNIPVSPQTFSSFYLEWVNTPSGLDLLLFINPAISSETKVKLTATMPVKTSELYGTHKCYKIAVLDSSFVNGSSVRDLYFKKYQTLTGLNSKAFFEIKSTNINSGFSTIPVSFELYGI